MSKYWYDRRGVLCDINGAVLGSKNIEKAKEEIKKHESKENPYFKIKKHPKELKYCSW